MVNASGERAKSLDTGLARTIQKLSRLSVTELKGRYREVFKEEPRVGHKEYLLRRIAWQLQASLLSQWFVR